MTARRAKQLYFTRHDTDLWEAINKLPDGDQNYEMRKALRFWFLGEGRETLTVQKSIQKGNLDVDNAIQEIKLPGGLFR